MQPTMIHDEVHSFFQHADINN